MLHVLAMLATGLLMLQHPSRWLSAAAWCFMGGIIFFSGALYVLVIGGPRWLGIPWGMVAPIGGTLQTAWLAGICRRHLAYAGQRFSTQVMNP